MSSSGTWAVGRVTKKGIEVKHTTSGKMMSKFCLSVNGGRKDEEGKTIYDNYMCIAFDHVTKLLDQLKVEAGTPLIVNGRMQQRSYDAGGGDNRIVWELVVEGFSFVPQPFSEDGQQQKSQKSGGSGYSSNKKAATKPEIDGWDDYEG